MSLYRQLLAMASLYARTVIWSRRSLIAGLIWLLPMVLFFIGAMRASGDGASRLELWQGFQFLGPLGFLVQFYGLFYGLAIVSEEVENGTLPYLLVRPFSRATILVGRYLAASAFTLIALTLMNVLLLAFARPATPLRALMAAQAMAFLGTLTYTAFFAFLATLFKKPLAAALLFLIGIDFGLSLVPIAIHNVTPKYHLLQLHAWLLDSGARSGAVGSDILNANPPSPWTSLVVLVVLCGLSLALTLRRFSRAQVGA
jgi:Cu-processing system permease protein